jgi:hypothetical protein
MKTDKVWVLVWGGGCEPESPAISLLRTKAAALRKARQDLECCCDAKVIARVIRELRSKGSAYEIEGTRDSFMELSTQQIND